MDQERAVCPVCKRTLRNVNAWNYCKEVSIDELFINKSDDILLAFDKILEHIAPWADVEISATKNCVVFMRNKTFLVIKPLTKWLEVKFYTPQLMEDEDLYKCVLWNNKYQGIIRVQHESELKPKFFNYFLESYQIS